MSDDRDLPAASITRVVKESLPEGAAVAKDAKLALMKAATQFIIHATTYANEETIRNKRKTISGLDVINAMDELEFQDFKGILEDSLRMFREKKEKKTKVVEETEVDDVDVDDAAEDNDNAEDESEEED
eukprot:CFRG1280T1